MKNFFQKLNSGLIFFNLIFLQSYLLRFSSWQSLSEIKIFEILTNPQEILILLNAMIFTILIIKNKKLLQTIKNLKNHWFIISLIILTSLSAILVYPSLINPQEINLDFIRHLKFLVFAGIFVFIALETFQTEQERKKALQVATLGAILFGLFSLNYNLFGFNIAHDARLLGPLDAAVYLAFYLSPFLIFSIIQYIENPKEKPNLTNALILGSLILATRSMGAIGANFIVISLFLLKKKNLKILQSKAIKTALVILGIIIVVAIFYTKILPSFQSQWSSLNERTEIWKVSLELLKNPQNLLLGLGFGQFQETYLAQAVAILGHQPLDFYVLQPHNIFLLFIFHYGILGLTLLIFIILKLIKKLAKPLKSTSSTTKIAQFILLYFLIHGLIDTPFFKNDLLILFILFAEMSFWKNYFKPATKSIKTP